MKVQGVYWRGVSMRLKDYYRENTRVSDLDKECIKLTVIHYIYYMKVVTKVLTSQDSSKDQVKILGQL